MSRKRFFISFLMLLVAVGESGAQRVTRSGTWGARSANGLALMGTWTAEPDSATGAVIGTWTAVDAQGRTVANGAWSAAKSATRWTGGWRANIAGRGGAYSGTWSAAVALKANAPFVELFENAIRSAVSGAWRAGSRSGEWSIRATAPGAPP